MSLDNEKMPSEIVTLAMERTEIEKGGFKHFMIKEIHDQPRVMRECLRGRVIEGSHDVRLGRFSIRQGFSCSMSRHEKSQLLIYDLTLLAADISGAWNDIEMAEELKTCDRFILCACGTSWHAAMVSPFPTVSPAKSTHGEYFTSSVCGSRLFGPAASG